MSDYTLDKLFVKFLNELSGQSPMTRRNYRSRLQVFLKRYGQYQPARIERRHINRWHQWLMKRDLAKATMAGYRQALRAFFNWLVASGYIDRNPTSHLKIGSFLPAGHKLPNEADVERITQMVVGMLEDRRGARRIVLGRQWRASNVLISAAYPEPYRVRDAAIWLLCRGCGPRAREVCNVRLSSLRRGLERGPDDAGIYSMSSHGKTGNTIMRFDERTAQALRDWLEVRPGNADSDYLFVSTRCLEGQYRQMTRASLAKLLVRLAKEAGVPRPIYTHALRHRIGDLTTQRHGPKVAALLLNHRDANTAATAIAFYHHPDELDVSRAVGQLG
jgi:integrase